MHAKKVMRQLFTLFFTVFLFSCGNGDKPAEIQQSNGADAGQNVINADMSFTTHYESLYVIPSSLSFMDGDPDERYVECLNKDVKIDNSFDLKKDRLVIESPVQKMKYRILSCDTCTTNKITDCENYTSYTMNLEAIGENRYGKRGILKVSDKRLYLEAQLFYCDDATNEIYALDIFTQD